MEGVRDLVPCQREPDDQNDRQEHDADEVFTEPVALSVRPTHIQSTRSALWPGLPRTGEHAR